MTVLLHDRAATGGVDGDELRTRPFECLDIATSERTRVFEVPGVGVERAATILAARFDESIAVDRENALRRAIGCAEQSFHHAAAQSCDRTTLAGRHRRVA